MTFREEGAEARGADVADGLGEARLEGVVEDGAEGEEFRKGRSLRQPETTWLESGWRGQASVGLSLNAESSIQNLSLT